MRHQALLPLDAPQWPRLRVADGETIRHGAVERFAKRVERHVVAADTDPMIWEWADAIAQAIKQDRFPRFETSAAINWSAIGFAVAALEQEVPNDAMSYMAHAALAGLALDPDPYTRCVKTLVMDGAFFMARTGLPAAEVLTRIHRSGPSDSDRQ